MSYDADSDGLLSEVNPRTSACLRISGTACAELEDGVGVLDPSWMIRIIRRKIEKVQRDVRSE